MKVTVALLLCSAAFAAAFHKEILDVETENEEHEQEGEAGKAVEGEYSWVAPDGSEHFVSYVADHRGYRVLDSNVVHEKVQAASPREHVM